MVPSYNFFTKKGRRGEVLQDPSKSIKKELFFVNIVMIPLTIFFTKTRKGGVSDYNLQDLFKIFKKSNFFFKIVMVPPYSSFLSFHKTIIKIVRGKYYKGVSKS